MQLYVNNTDLMKVSTGAKLQNLSHVELGCLGTNLFLVFNKL